MSLGVFVMHWQTSCQSHPARDCSGVHLMYRAGSAGCQRKTQFDYGFVRVYTVSTAFPSLPSGMMLYAVIVK